MKKVYLIFVLIFMVGCTTGTRQTIIALSESDVKNVSAWKMASKNLLTTWPFYSGAIRGALGEPGLSEMPKSFNDAVDRLDVLAGQYDPEDETSLTDKEWGESIALRAKLFTDATRAVFKIYAPDVLEYVPAILGGVL